MGGYCNIRSPVFSQSKLFGSLGCPDGLVEKHLPAMQETQRRGFNPWARKIPGGGSGNPLQDSCLENPMDR